MSSLQTFNQNYSNVLKFSYTTVYAAVCTDGKDNQMGTMTYNKTILSGGVCIATAKQAGRKKKCAHFVSSAHRDPGVMDIRNVFLFLKRYCKEANLANFAGENSSNRRFMLDAPCLSNSVSGSGNRKGKLTK